MIFDWMLFLELTLKAAVITNVLIKALCSTPSKNLLFQNWVFLTEVMAV